MKQFTQHTARLRSRRARAGFTLLELMVAMAAGAMVVSSAYFVTGATSAYFREQQRISNTQGSLRYAMDELRRDIARAGFGATPNNLFYPPCQPSGIIGTQITALRVQLNGQNSVLDPAGGHQVDGIPLEADILDLTGNYATSSEYLTRGVVGAGGSVVVDPNWMSFTRDFVAFANNTYDLDANAFGEAFLPGRMVRVRSANGSRYFSRITGVVVPPALPISPSVILGNPIIAPCAALGTGATVNPVSIMRYAVVPADPVLAPTNQAAAGVNNVLVRREVDVAGAPLANTFNRVVAERVVHFNVDLIQNTNALRNTPPVLATVVGVNATVVSTANPERIFSAIVTLGIRSSLADNRFPWIAQPAGAELTRYRFNPNSAASTRVRIARAEIFLPNIAYEWTNN